MVFILYFVRILPQKNGSKIPGNGQISTKMHGISFAVGAPPFVGAHITPMPPPLSEEGSSRFEASGPGKTMIRPCLQTQISVSMPAY